MADPNQNNTQMVTIGQLLVQAVNGVASAINGTFPNWVDAPANGTASGVAGQVAFSGSATATAYLYVCVASNVWGRVQLTTSF